jgi:hypothetical protein
MDGKIPKIDVRPVKDGYERVVDYVFKTIKRVPRLVRRGRANPAKGT